MTPFFEQAGLGTNKVVKGEVKGNCEAQHGLAASPTVLLQVKYAQTEIAKSIYRGIACIAIDENCPW